MGCNSGKSRNEELDWIDEYHELMKRIRKISLLYFTLQDLCAFLEARDAFRPGKTLTKGRIRNFRKAVTQVESRYHRAQKESEKFEQEIEKWSRRFEKKHGKWMDELKEQHEKS